ncbi:hypothetical protein [Mesorhizobium sp. Mes31]|uniref:hypothetical protein n=1 Tax=Mesorhizobium sp. Mes31 TaxID=2926017 RepID=UPI0021178297|nr:hypothetical protein [Mesorhizobium sp. Mes31]
MLFEAFTGGFLGDPGMRGRIDTRLLRGNVFYREKTVLRQLFFHCSSAWPWVMGMLQAPSQAMHRRKAIPLFGAMR